MSRVLASFEFSASPVGESGGSVRVEGEFDTRRADGS
jgi:hypothetical protein